MKIGIVTVYEPITNMGSYLQGYALKTVLEKMGHEVYFVQNIAAAKVACKYLCRINPKREFFLRFKKVKEFLHDVHRIKCVPRERILQEQFDLLVYGSDEIWNLDNPYFDDGLFWGLDVGDTNKIAYAVSVGAVKDSSLMACTEYLQELFSFRTILPRDARTKEVVDRVVGGDHEIVCDPTLLLSLEDISESIQLPKNRYMLVYTYGLDKELQNTVVSYARKHNLKIVSPCFWHPWVDEVIECSALQFSTLIQGAECVFTTTFHGAIFTLLNHKRCCIYPVREKVKDLVVRLGEEQRLIEETCSSQYFEQIMAQPFDDEAFEARLEKWRKYSMDRLKEAISCLGK